MELPLIEKDPLLKKYEPAIRGLMHKAEDKEKELVGNGDLLSFANAHLHYGLTRTHNSWIYRDRMPGADEVFLTGSFNYWQIDEQYRLFKNEDGDWEREFPLNAISDGDYYRIFFCRGGQCEFRVPAFAKRVIQDKETLMFNAQVCIPEQSFTFQHKSPEKKDSVLIYEAHIGMSSEYPIVASFNDFRVNVLPYIKEAGYDTIQLMGIQEHPYYGSFGYHVANFYAVSSRFGTPNELKRLIDEAHSLGIRVIMDLVHSHAVKNRVEGIGYYDGTDYLYFHSGQRGLHSAWDSRCFDYGKNAVLHFLLSNCKYWLEVYNFDGFRFDGVTSMLYLDHGLGVDFGNYDMYFNLNRDEDAMIYLMLANKLIKLFNPNAIAIAEEVSAMPGLAFPLQDGGLGFDYRLAMGVPDYWVKLITETKDEQWHVGDMFYRLTDKRIEERVISYAESHDQALVGDKTIIFRLADANMYYFMDISQMNLVVQRAVALHKMIRLVTVACAGNGYLNFMGNEFGHPEWIDFPREGNRWSHFYARRQWNLAYNKNLAYYYLAQFDRDMIELIKKYNVLSEKPEPIARENYDMVLVFKRADIILVFNFNPTQSFVNYKIEMPEGSYKIILSSDNGKYLGYNRIDEETIYKTEKRTLKDTDKKKEDDKEEKEEHYLSLYVVNRAAFVLKKIDDQL